MSKLIDSLTGYFFPGEHATVASGAAASGDHATTTADRPIGDSQDLSPAAYRRIKNDPGPASPGGLRLRDRLWLRRPVQRTAPGSQMPWGDEDVASPSHRADAGGSHHVEPEVPLFADGRLARVESHPDPDALSVRPRVRRVRPLGLDRGRRRVARSREGEEEGVALRVDLDPGMGAEALAHDASEEAARDRVVFDDEDLD